MLTNYSALSCFGIMLADYCVLPYCGIVSSNYYGLTVFWNYVSQSLWIIALLTYVG